MSFTCIMVLTLTDFTMKTAQLVRKNQNIPQSAWVVLSFPLEYLMSPNKYQIYSFHLKAEYGVRYHPLFFLEADYWCPGKEVGERSKLMTPSHSVSQAVDVEAVGANMDDKLAMRFVFSVFSALSLLKLCTVIIIIFLL